MLIRNRNFVQLAELVCLQLLCFVLVLFPSYCLILMRSFSGHYDYLEYDLPASRIPVSAEGCGEAATLRSMSFMLSASLAEVESRSRRWEKEAKEGVKKVAGAETERDAARHEASMARIDSNAAGSARAKVESELARVQNALAISEEARQKAEDEASCLAVERVSLLIELMTSKDEVSTLQAQAFKEKKALDEAYEEGFDVIFNYGYGCCAFAHNICGSQPIVPDGV